MKILFITSGYKGIYNYFETWIINELKTKHNLILFPCQNGPTSFQSLTKSYRPDVAITLVGFKFPIKLVKWLKTQQVKTVVWFTEDPYFMDQTELLLQNYDFVFTIDTAALDYYKNIGHHQVYHLPLGTEPNVFRPKQIEPKYKSDICLVGFPYPDRIHYIQILLQNTSYKISVVGNWKKYLNRFRNHPNLVIHEGWVEPSISANYYNGSNIVFNTHRPFNLKENKNRLGVVGKSINNRTFDAAACGAFQLIEFKEDLPNHFIADEEIISFKNHQELIEKINYYMPIKEERQRIAVNARNRVLKDHTFEKRIDRMLTIIEGSY
jgi:spore maturation protein CgeB